MKTLSQQRLGRYQIEAEIGRGAMGVVYRAFDPKIDRTVAIKTISLAHQELADEQDYRQRFVQEARAAGRLSHPGIVTIFDAGEDTETHEPYLVMEYVAGEPLSKVLSAANGKLPLPAALQFAQEIADALAYAHSQGVIHRDIKPANILVTEDGHAKIADFGVARLNQEVVTQVGQVVGSPAYMAPEQMLGRAADARSDLFSLGVILYSLITGFRPFQGNSAQTVCFKVMNVEPVPVTSFRHEVPPQVDAIISRAIAKDPADRYQSGAEMAKDLQAFRETDQILAATTTFFARVVRKNEDWSRPSRKPAKDIYRTLTLGSVILAMVFGAAEFAWRKTHINTPSLALAVTDARTAPAPTQIRPPALVPAAVKPATHKSRSLKKPPKQLEDEQLPEPAKVEVEIQHHFGSAKASIWFDDALVLDQDLRGADQRHPLLRAVEMNQIATLHLAAGRHRLQVRIASLANDYDQIEKLDAELSPGSQHVLKVNCDKRKMLVALQ